MLVPLFTGCTCDDTELPHHVSTQDEISSLLNSSQKFLEALVIILKTRTCSFYQKISFFVEYLLSLIIHRNQSRFVHFQGGKIAVVTVARSSLDDFCPQNQVNYRLSHLALVQTWTAQNEILAHYIQI